MALEVSVQIRVNSSSLMEELNRVISSLDGFRLIQSEILEPGDLLIFEAGKDPVERVRFLHSVKSGDKIQGIFLITPKLDPKGMVEARKAGADKIFVHPFQREELKSALLQFKEERLKKSSAHGGEKTGTIIYILGCKGGVGTTTVALNLASALTKLDKSRSILLTEMTGLLDDMPVLLNIHPLLDWAKLMKNIPRIDVSLLKEVLEKHPSGFFVLPSPSTLEAQRLDPEALSRILSSMGRALDFLVIDGGKSAGDVSAGIFELAETLLLVTNLTRPCLENGKTILSFFKKVGPYPEDKIKLVVNRYQKNSPISLEEAEKQLNKKVFWTIPNDFQALTEAAKLGRPLLDLGGEKAISKSFMALATFFLMQRSPGQENSQDGKKLPDKSDWAKLAFPSSLKLKPS